MPENLFRDLKKHPQRLFLYLLNVSAVHSGKVLLEIFSWSVCFKKQRKSSGENKNCFTFYHLPSLNFFQNILTLLQALQHSEILMKNTSHYADRIIKQEYIDIDWSGEL